MTVAAICIFLLIKANCNEIKYDFTIGPDQVVFIEQRSDAHLPSDVAHVLRMFLWLVWVGSADADHSRRSGFDEGTGRQYDHCFGVIHDHRAAGDRAML